MEGLNQNHHVKTIRELLGLEPEVFVLPTEGQASGKPPVLEESVLIKEPPVRISKPKRRVWDYVRYPLLFCISLAFFYGILNFRALVSQISGMFSKPVRQEKKVLEEISPHFKRWIRKYYVHVNDQQILAAKNDADQDGLTNLNEFKLGTNPLLKDTDGDLYSDGREVLNGYNPLYEGKLTPTQQAIIKDFDQEGIESRNNLESSRVAGETDVAFNQQGRPGLVSLDAFVQDPVKPGNLLVPKLGVEAPIVWSRQFENLEEALKSGVVHHPQTVYPGKQGTSSIHGHSSGYPWDGNYKYVFTKINLLEPGDEVFVTVYNASAESRRYRFVVRSKRVFAKNDPAQFQNVDGYFLNLSTSWPIGNSRERYVVTTELVGL